MRMINQRPRSSNLRPSWRSTIAAVLIVAGLVCLLNTSALAQESASGRAAKLREQLVEVKAQQIDLSVRLQQVEENLEPENIEHSLAGVGSTHPEELRETRRRQLEIERKGIQSQLDSLARSQTRLEAAIARADAESYWESAGSGSNRPPDSDSPSDQSSNQSQTRRAMSKRKGSGRPD